MSESLIATVKRLAELDTKIMPGDLNVEYEMLSRMLEVLSLFKTGDAASLEAMIENARVAYADELGPDMSELDLLERLQKAANSMEATQ